jgi:outer membrane murein-binding lipoprotein Lpp
MKFKAAFSKFLTNKIVLNVVTVIAILNIIGMLSLGNYNGVAYFVILALLITYFSKNMIIVLGVPVILVNLFVSKSSLLTEGMENNTATDKTNTNVQNLSAQNKHSETIKKINQQDAKSKQGLPITPLDSTSSTTNTSSSNATTDESFEVGRGKKKGYEIDYASTVEDAYDSLNKILGSDGVKRLTGDTQQLLKQQQQLAESMQSMAPMIQSMAPMMKQAQDLLGGMGDSKEGLGGIMDIAKKFSGGMGGVPKK